jgi:hypothetical protein
MLFYFSITQASDTINDENTLLGKKYSEKQKLFLLSFLEIFTIYELFKINWHIFNSSVSNGK